MKFEPVPRMPGKSRLSWRICRLRLDASGTAWQATASKGTRAAVILLPDLNDPHLEEEWIAEIEARFERQAFEPFTEELIDPGLREARSEARSRRG